MGLPYFLYGIKSSYTLNFLVIFAGNPRFLAFLLIV